jgi:VanZ family protein
MWRRSSASMGDTVARPRTAKAKDRQRGTAGGTRARKAPGAAAAAFLRKGRAGGSGAGRTKKSASAKPQQRTGRAGAAGGGARKQPGPGLGARILRALVGTVALLGFAVCAAVVVKLTLTPSPASVGIAHTNLRPGTSIRLYLDQPSVREAVLQVGGNILIGVPFGLLLPVISPRARGLLRVVLTTVLVVLVLEVAQHFFVRGRSFDVDDLILAAIGAVIGYVPVGRYLSLRIHPGHRHWWQRLLGTWGRRSGRSSAA